jgi:hypothetical protein
MDFPAFLQTAFDHGGCRGGKSYALDHGVDEVALVRYANGAVSVYERREIQGVISRNEWARNFVIDHVKRQRAKRNAA